MVSVSDCLICADVKTLSFSDYNAVKKKLKERSFLLNCKMICCGFFLVTNVLIVSRFGPKRLLNALNVNVSVNVIHW